LTQEELSERVGVHYTFLGHIERGTKAPSLFTLKRIADALGIGISEIFKGI
jgi:transcriptional regulator with XRE-family HTH domain